MTILDERPLTDAERAAISDEPRPGVWIRDESQIDPQATVRGAGTGDGRLLTQDQTDIAIVSELYWTLDSRERALLMKFVDRIVCGQPALREDQYRPEAFAWQRSGIHSEPLVRLLAFRAWDDRDRTWRKRDTASALPRIKDDNTIDRLLMVYGFGGLSTSSDGTYLAYTAERGVRQATVRVSGSDVWDDFDILLNIFDELDAKLSAAGEPVPSGPLAFDLDARGSTR